MTAFLEQEFYFDCWEECINVQQEMKAVDLLNCWLFYLQVQNHEIMLSVHIGQGLAGSGQMKVNRHPGLQNDWQMIFSKNLLVDGRFLFLFDRYWGKVELRFCSDPNKVEQSVVVKLIFDTDWFHNRLVILDHFGCRLFSQCRNIFWVMIHRKRDGLSKHRDI